MEIVKLETKFKNLDLIFLEHKKLKAKIAKRLIEFKKIPKENYFYELCFCICTPQSKAVNAMKVQKVLENKRFYEKNLNPKNILNNKENYIRFHNTKAKNLIAMKEQFSEICKNLKSDSTIIEKRDWLAENVLGIGLKESSHFLRNIGYEGEFAILDRHILKQLINHGVIKKIPVSLTKKEYLKIEKQFCDFANKISISINELDLLFWARVTGFILK